MMLLAVWAPLTLITVFHYLTSPEWHWFHDILRRLYYLPIILAAFAAGLRGGLLAALITVVAYSPHAFTHVGHHDPALPLEKVLELGLYLVVGGVTGLLVDRERQRHRELREALAAQERTADQLIRAGRLAALGELVAGIAHEVKNPLHTLRGTAEVVDPLVPETSPERRLWKLHLQELDRLQQVADRFLSFARPAPLERRPVPPLQLLERTRDLIAAQARKQQVEVAVQSPDHRGPPGLGGARPLPEVPADEQQLIQVLLNIALNALQAIGERGHGEIRLAATTASRGGRDYVVLGVQNDGPAVPEADLERIFDPFVTGKSEGVGLGLSIAARIVEQHEGFIEMRNLQQGPGVAFSVWLPLH
jgi:signal transduction histidine kinase